MVKKRGGNEKNVSIMLKWWNKQIKFQNNAKMVKKGGKRIKCEKMLKWWEKGEFGL